MCVSPERASESPLLGGIAPAIGWIPPLWPTHGRGRHIQWFKVKLECMSVSIIPPLLQLGPMSLMQFWTKFYSQLGRPPPKVLVLFASFVIYILHWIKFWYSLIFFATSFVFEEACWTVNLTNRTVSWTVSNLLIREFVDKTSKHLWLFLYWILTSLN